MNKIQICKLAIWASEQLQKCHWWQIKRKKILFEIIYQGYLDIRI